MTRRKYRAFISYSHRDTKWGTWLQSALEGYKIPKDMIGRETEAGVVPENLRPIFRDRLDLSAGPSLQAKLEEALEASDNLIVICSPSSAGSEYVNEEVRRFKAMGKADRILALIVDGAPGVPEQECFPQALRFAVDDAGEITDQAVEPVGADVRAEADGRTNAKLKIISGLLGLELDDLLRREQIAERKRKRLLFAVAASMTVLAIVASGAAAWNYVLLSRNQSLVREQVKLLDGTLERATELVDRSVEFSRREGIPATMPKEILRQVELMFEDLVETDLGKQSVTLKAREAVMLLRIAQNRGFLGDTALREQYARRVVDILEPLVRDANAPLAWHGDLAWGYTELGVVYVTKGNLKQALASITKGFEIRKALVDREPENWGWNRSLSNSYARTGDILMTQGDSTGALKSYQTALKIKTDLAAQSPDNSEIHNELSGVHIKIGLVHRSWGDAQTAKVSFTTALEILQKLTQDEPLNAYWRRDLSVVQEHLGDLHLTQGDVAVARRWYEACFDVRKRLAEADRSNVMFQNDLAFGYTNFGAVFHAEKNWEEALGELNKALEIRQRLYEEDKINAGWRFNLGLSHRLIGDTLLASGKLTEALAQHLEQQAILRKLIDEDGSNLLWQRDLAHNHFTVGKLKAELQNFAEARDEYQAAAEIEERLGPVDAVRGVSFKFRFELYRRTASLNARLGEAAGEIAAWEAAKSMASRLAAMYPDQVQWQGQIAAMLDRIGKFRDVRGDFDAAEAAYGESLQIRERLAKASPDNVKLSGNLAVRYLRTGQFYRANNQPTRAMEMFALGLKTATDLVERAPDEPRWKTLLKGISAEIAQLKSQAAAQ